MVSIHQNEKLSKKFVLLGWEEHQDTLMAFLPAHCGEKDANSLRGIFQSGL